MVAWGGYAYTQHSCPYVIEFLLPLSLAKSLIGVAMLCCCRTVPITDSDCALCIACLGGLGE